MRDAQVPIRRDGSGGRRAERAGTPVLPDRYQVGNQIGTGGFAGVWVAADTLSGDHVAVKVPRGRDDFTLQQFRQEAEMTSALHHANVVRTLDFSVDPQTPYLAMELVNGQTLNHRLSFHGPMDPDRTIAVATQIAAGLDASHRAEIIHRDLSPFNVMLTAQGTAKIMDFGTATYAAPQYRDPFPQITTPGYTAPERLHGRFGSLEQRGGPHSDLYSLGAIMRHMLTGRPIVPGEPLRDLGELRPDLPPELRRVVAQLMMPDPAARPSSAAEVRDLLPHLKSRAETSLSPAASLHMKPPGQAAAPSPLHAVQARGRLTKPAPNGPRHETAAVNATVNPWLRLTAPGPAVEKRMAAGRTPGTPARRVQEPSARVPKPSPNAAPTESPTRIPVSIANIAATFPPVASLAERGQRPGREVNASRPILAPTVPRIAVDQAKGLVPKMRSRLL